MKKKVVVAVAGLFAAGIASADDYAVSGKLSTLGLGVELTKPFSDSVTGRIGLNGYSYSKSANESHIDYDFKLKLQTVSALADWYPWQGTFRASAGLVYDNNKVDLTAKPSAGGTYDINGQTYQSSDVGSLNGGLKFDSIVPYLGIGWGNPVAKEKDWGFVADIGFLYSKPKATLNVTCGAAINPATCTSLKSDVQTEQGKLEDALKNFKWFPVVSLGISKKF